MIVQPTLLWQYYITKVWFLHQVGVTCCKLISGTVSLQPSAITITIFSLVKSEDCQHPMSPKTILKNKGNNDGLKGNYCKEPLSAKTILTNKGQSEGLKSTNFIAYHQPRVVFHLYAGCWTRSVDLQQRATHRTEEPDSLSLNHLVNSFPWNTWINHHIHVAHSQKQGPW